MSSPGKTLGLVGTGNLAWALTPQLQSRGWEVRKAIGRRTESISEFSEKFGVPTSTELQNLPPDLDLVWVCTPDREIPGVVEKLRQICGPDTYVIHSSGSVSIQALAPFGKKGGVVYPLQSFSKGHVPDWREIPVFWEADSDEKQVFQAISGNLSPRYSLLDSPSRRILHLGAVFASNFPNFLLGLAGEIASPLGFGSEVYGPLAKETLRKALLSGPFSAQTGPARRGDSETMERHREMLSANPDLAELYRLLSGMIQSRYP